MPARPSLLCSLVIEWQGDGESPVLWTMSSGRLNNSGDKGKVNMTGGLKRTAVTWLVLAALYFFPLAAIEAQAGFVQPTECGAVSVLKVQEPPDPLEKPNMGRKISCDFQKADIRDVIRSIAKVSGKNVVISDSVKGKITLKLKNVPWDQALDAVLSSRNLAVEESGDVLMIYDLPTLQKIRAGRKSVKEQKL